MIMIRVKAYEYGYGLFIHRLLLNSEKMLMDRSWVVSAKCGYGICSGFDSKKEAKGFCGAIKELGKWELDDPRRVRESASKEQIFNLLKRQSQ